MTPWALAFALRRIAGQFDDKLRPILIFREPHQRRIGPVNTLPSGKHPPLPESFPSDTANSLFFSLDDLGDPTR